PVPPSDPAPWETGAVPLARYFPADPAAGLAHRIVVYRHPLQARVADRAEEALLLREVLVEQVAHMLGRSPEDIDPGYTAHSALLPVSCAVRPCAVLRTAGGSSPLTHIGP